MADLPDKPVSANAPSMPFLDHLEELRWRLLKSGLAVVLMSGLAFAFSNQLIELIMRPLGDIPLFVTDVTGSFYAYLKISLVAGVVAALPVVFFQLWSFIGPGLYQSEKRIILPMVTVSTLLFLTGAAFCYFLVLPLALNFLIGFSEGLFSPIITVGSYIGFAGLLVIAFGFAFQLPIIAFFLGRIGLVSSRFLGKGRRYAFVIILIVGAIITPPDVFTQVLLAVPLYLLYEISVIVVRLTGRAEKRHLDDTDSTDTTPPNPYSDDLAG